MKFHQLILVLNVAFQTKVASQTVPVEKNDHLTCFKINDNLKIEDTVVNMIANKAQEKYTVRGCELKNGNGAVRMCIPSTKEVLSGEADPTLGGLVQAYDPDRCLQNDFLCYQVKCEEVNTQKRKMIDQFNKNGKTRKIKTAKNKIEICTPAWKLDKDQLVIIDCPSSTECEQLDECSANEGICVKDCLTDDVNGITCKEICKQDSGCTCKIDNNKCVQYTSCTSLGGTCTNDCIDVQGVNTCDQDLCNEEDCVCKIPVVSSKFCFVHPDPHFRTFDGLYFDFQMGCDVVLVTTPEIDIHLRLAKNAIYPQISQIDSVAIRINSDILEVVQGTNNYYLNDITRSSPNPSVSNVGGYNFMISPLEYTIELPPNAGTTNGHFIAVTKDNTAWGLSVTIKGHTTLFSNTKGMCGNWNLSGLINRDGIVVAPNSFGEDWQVGIGSSDPVILSDVALYNPPLFGHNAHPNNCIARRRLEKHRILQGKTCNYCSKMTTSIQNVNCEYDAIVFGCKEVKAVPFYDEAFNNENVRFYSPEITSSDKCMQTEACGEMNGTCVKNCVPNGNANIACEADMCNGEDCVCRYDNSSPSSN